MTKYFSKFNFIACRFTSLPPRTRFVPAPTVHRLFNGFLSEGVRRGVAGGTVDVCKIMFAVFGKNRIFEVSKM